MYRRSQPLRPQATQANHKIDYTTSPSPHSSSTNSSDTQTILPKNGNLTLPTHRQLSQRQKQIDFGLVTPGFWNYCAHVIKKNQLNGTIFFIQYIDRSDPKINFDLLTWEFWNHSAQGIPTPVLIPAITEPFSKRGWDDLASNWRRFLHAWDDIPCDFNYEENPVWIHSILPSIQQARQNVHDLTTNLQFDPTKLQFDSTKLENSLGTHPCKVDPNTFFAPRHPVASTSEPIESQVQTNDSVNPRM